MTPLQKDQQTASKLFTAIIILQALGIVGGLLYIIHLAWSAIKWISSFA